MRTFVAVMMLAIGVVLLIAGANGSASQLWASVFGKGLPSKRDITPGSGNGNSSSGSVAGQIVGGIVGGIGNIQLPGTTATIPGHGSKGPVIYGPGGGSGGGIPRHEPG